MIEIRTPDWNDEEYADGMSTYAILDLRGIKIPLNKNDVDDLKEEIERYTKPQYCYQCRHFLMNKYGEWRHGGSCCKDEPVDIELAGNKNCKDCLDSCKDFKER